MSKSQTGLYLIISTIAFAPVVCYGVMGKALESIVGLHGNSFLIAGVAYMVFWVAVLILSQNSFKGKYNG